MYIIDLRQFSHVPRSTGSKCWSGKSSIESLYKGWKWTVSSNMPFEWVTRKKTSQLIAILFNITASQRPIGFNVVFSWAGNLYYALPRQRQEPFHVHSNNPIWYKIASFDRKKIVLCLYKCFWFTLQIAPPGMRNVQTMACGTCSVEHGIKAIFMRYMVGNPSPQGYIHKKNMIDNSYVSLSVFMKLMVD